jgi:hypothetical protein
MVSHIKNKLDRLIKLDYLIDRGIGGVSFGQEVNEIDHLFVGS